MTFEVEQTSSDVAVEPSAAFLLVELSTFFVEISASLFSVFVATSTKLLSVFVATSAKFLSIEISASFWSMFIATSLADASWFSTGGSLSVLKLIEKKLKIKNTRFYKKEGKKLRKMLVSPCVKKLKR
jgi:hypothetical protein